MGHCSSQVTCQRLGGGSGCVIGDMGHDRVVVASYSLVTWDAGGDVIVGDMGYEKVVVASLSLVTWDVRRWWWCHHHHQ